MIFLSGHGIKTSDQRYFFLPYDYDSNRVERTTIEDFDLLTNIGGKAIFFFDTSYSGAVRTTTTRPDAVLTGRRTSTQPDAVPTGRMTSTQPGAVLAGRTTSTQLDVDKFANELKAAENGIVVFTSTTGNDGRNTEGGPGWGDSGVPLSAPYLGHGCHPHPAASRPTSPLHPPPGEGEARSDARRNMITANFSASLWQASQGREPLFGRHNPCIVYSGLRSGNTT
jgi:hypothetical protein